jgi:RNA polymerase sigma-70 factor (ECF subfamily)
MRANFSLMFGIESERMILTSPSTPSETPLSPRDLDDLARRSRKGDRAAFNALVRHFHGTTFRLACRMLRDPEAAADATQEIFLKAWNHLHRFRGASRFSTWLHSIAVHHCLDAARRQSREALRTQPLFWESDGNPEAASPEPSSPTVSWDTSLVIQEALSKLPEKLLTVVVLHYYGGYTVTNMSEALGLPARTVRHQLATAMDRLQRTLGNREEIG